MEELANQKEIPIKPLGFNSGLDGFATGVYQLTDNDHIYNIPVHAEGPLAMEKMGATLALRY